MRIADLFSPPLSPGDVVGVRVRVELTIDDKVVRDAMITLNVPAELDTKFVGDYAADKAALGIAAWIQEGSEPFDPSAWAIAGFTLGGYDNPAISLV